MVQSRASTYAALMRRNENNSASGTDAASGGHGGRSARTTATTPSIAISTAAAIAGQRNARPSERAPAPPRASHSFARRVGRRRHTARARLRSGRMSAGRPRSGRLKRASSRASGLWLS
jgi:hypothetical protein